MVKKQRLDIILFERGLAASREKARAMIMAGEVLMGERLVDKPGMKVDIEAELKVKEKPRFVSRGGDKLAGALDDFDLDVTGRVAADVGASTGGFTDCLLQNHVTRVYAIDVGYGQLDYTLRQDERVMVMERTNARYLQQLDEPVNLVVIDASFISLRLLLPAVKGWLASPSDILALIKPQFEAGKDDVGKGGVVRDSQVHERVLQETLAFTDEQGFMLRGLTLSRLKGPAGNIEFLVWLGWQYTDLPALDAEALIKSMIAD